MFSLTAIVSRRRRAFKASRRGCRIRDMQRRGWRCAGRRRMLRCQPPVPPSPAPVTPFDPLLSDPAFLAAVTVAVTLLGISKGGFLGIGVAAVPVVSLLVPPQQAVAILLPIILAQDAVSIWVYRHDFSAWNLKVLLPGVAAGALLAFLFAAAWSVAMIRLAVGLIALIFVLSRIADSWLRGRLPKPNAASGFLWGIAAGFASTLANAGGPAFQVHVLPQRLPPLTFVGTTTMFFAFSNVLKIPAYYGLGTLTWHNVAIGLAFVPLAVATNMLGVWLVRRVSTVLFYRIAYALITLLALALIRSGIAGLGAT